MEKELELLNRKGATIFSGIADDNFSQHLCCPFTLSLLYLSKIYSRFESNDFRRQSQCHRNGTSCVTVTEPVPDNSLLLFPLLRL
jgi:hypothetical protein